MEVTLVVPEVPVLGDVVFQETFVLRQTVPRVAPYASSYVDGGCATLPVHVGASSTFVVGVELGTDDVLP